MDPKSPLKVGPLEAEPSIEWQPWQPSDAYRPSPPDLATIPGQASRSASTLGSAPAHLATYAATLTASSPVTRSAGIPLPVVGNRIWSRTTFLIALSS